MITELNPEAIERSVSRRFATLADEGRVQRTQVLIISREVTPGRITVVLVDEVLGF